MTDVRKARVLVVDDEAISRRLVAGLVASMEMEAVTAENGAAALEAVSGPEPFHAIVSDISMPHMSGVELLRELQAREIDVPLVFITAVPKLETAIEAVKLGAFSYLTKPFDIEELKKTVRRAVGLGTLAQLRLRAARLVRHHEGPLAPPLSGPLDRAMAQMWMAYQPILASADGSLVGYEALLRSHYPGLSDPLAIIHLAETLGQVSRLFAAIDTSIARTLGAHPDPKLFFVNLHPSQLFDPALASVHNPLMVHSDRIVYEITERASLTDVAQAKEMADRLRQRGCRVAVDDLGSGYSGLSSLVTLAPEIVKLDITLVRDIDRDRVKQTLVRSIVTSCHELGTEVVGEGIETVEESRTLRDLSVDMLQGNLFSEPGPAFPTLPQPLPW